MYFFTVYSYLFNSPIVIVLLTERVLSFSMNLTRIDIQSSAEPFWPSNTGALALPLQRTPSDVLSTCRKSVSLTCPEVASLTSLCDGHVSV